MLRAHQQRAFDHLIVVVPGELWPAIDVSLHADLRACVTGHLVLDLERASPEEITRVVAPVIEHAEHARERRLLRKLRDALGSGVLAIAGVDAVLNSLEQRRVGTLLVADGAQLAAGRCPRCGRVSGSREHHCSLDRSMLAPVDAVQYAIERAHRQRADVVVVSHESAELRQRGSIAALLRRRESSDHPIAQPIPSDGEQPDRRGAAIPVLRHPVTTR